MAEVDPYAEFRRLAAVYAEMPDGQLAELTADMQSLSDEAKQALQAEISRRGLSSERHSPREEAPEPELRKLITIGRFRDLPAALLAQGALQSAGIESFLADENTVRMDWFWANALGGMRLQVDEEDAAEALAVLDLPTPEYFETERGEIYHQPRCPRCKSTDIERDKLGQGVALAALYVAHIPIPTGKSGWKCLSCGHAWMEDQEQAEFDG